LTRISALKHESPFLLVELNDAHLEVRMRKATRDGSRRGTFVACLGHNDVNQSVCMIASVGQILDQLNEAGA